jgi:hypothetical protein
MPASAAKPRVQKPEDPRPQPRVSRRQSNEAQPRTAVPRDESTAATLLSPTACNEQRRPRRVKVVVANTPVFIHPRQLPEPLTNLNVGVSLPVSEASADWFLVAFENGPLGPRVGYVHCSNVEPGDGPPTTPSTAESFAPTSSSTSIVNETGVGQRQPPETQPPAKSRMSTKKKVAIAAVITGAVIGAAILASKAGGGGGGGGAAVSPRVGPPSVSGGGATFGAGTELLLFGGQNHRVFLGCLTCSEYDSGSILNQFGEYGSEFSSTSIFNAFSEYGSAFSTYSACNQFASDPPVIVDRQGNAYGRLTINPYAYQVRAPQIVAWLTGVCQSH